MSEWFPGAKRISSPRKNSMAHNRPTRKATFHREEGNSTAEQLAHYVIGKAVEYSIIVDGHGDVVQIYPVSAAARSLLNGGLDGGIGANRLGSRNVQLVATGWTARGWLSDKQRDKCREIALWLEKHHGIPAKHAGDGSRNLDRFLHRDGWFSHSEVPGNDHTDRPPNWDWLDTQKLSTGKAEKKKKKKLVSVTVNGKPVYHLTREDGPKFSLNPEHAKKHPLGHMQRDTAQEALAWAEKRFPKADIKVGKAGGRLTLRDGAHWPTDKRTVKALKRVAADLGREVRIISGLRTHAEQAHLYALYQSGHGNLAAPPGHSEHEFGHAADVNVVDEHGNLVSLGNYPGGYKSARKHGLHFSAQGEAWHVSPDGPDRWAP